MPGADRGLVNVLDSLGTTTSEKTGTEGRDRASESRHA
jgi:hypothetical protein